MPIKELISDRYRPKTLEDAFLHPKHRKRFQYYQKEGLDSHLIFYGLSGLGKTSVAKILGKDLDTYKHTFDGSRKPFFSSFQRAISGVSLFSAGKLFILDEFQNAPVNEGRSIAKYLDANSTNTRFIIITNDPDDLPPQAGSRTLAINFNYAQYDEQKNKVIFYDHFPEKDVYDELRKLAKRVLEGEGVPEPEHTAILEPVISNPRYVVDLRRFVSRLGDSINGIL